MRKYSWTTFPLTEPCGQSTRGTPPTSFSRQSFKVHLHPVCWWGQVRWGTSPTKRTRLISTDTLCKPDALCPWQTEADMELLFRFTGYDQSLLLKLKTWKQKFFSWLCYYARQSFITWYWGGGGGGGGTVCLCALKPVGQLFSAYSVYVLLSLLIILAYQFPATKESFPQMPYHRGVQTKCCLWEEFHAVVSEGGQQHIQIAALPQRCRGVHT